MTKISYMTPAPNPPCKFSASCAAFQRVSNHHIIIIGANILCMCLLKRGRRKFGLSVVAVGGWVGVPTVLWPRSFTGYVGFGLCTGARQTRRTRPVSPVAHYCLYRKIEAFVVCMCTRCNYSNIRRVCTGTYGLRRYTAPNCEIAARCMHNDRARNWMWETNAGNWSSHGHKR